MTRLIPQPKEITELGSVCEAPDKINYINDSSVESAEGYILEITSDSVIISASDERGFFYGKMTLRQLKMISGGALPCLRIKDSPEFSYRGFMLDCARHMISVDEMKKMIDLAAMLKFNRFHWHLSDDQGFRIELESFPQLTKLGSVRSGDNFGSMCSSGKPYSGYYTKAEIKDIIEFCRERYIEVIPEIDMPGHTSAILHVFPELSCRKQPVEVKTRQGIYKDNLCIGNSETTDFIKTLLDELCELFPCEYFHIGGDEAPDDYRKNCPECQRMIKENGLSDSSELQCLFADSISEYLKSKGRTAIVWNDILKGGKIRKDITVQRWLDPKKKALEAANGGNKVIVSDFKPYYFDYPYGMYPLKKAYTHNPTGDKILSDEGRKNIIGIETPLWTEFVDTPERLEYLCLPRWFAVSETAWTAQSQKDYSLFRPAAVKLTEVLNQNGFSCAPEKDFDMPLHRRLKDTLSFFRAFLAK